MPATVMPGVTAATRLLPKTTALSGEPRARTVCTGAHPVHVGLVVIP
jgi:hypothetical protein